MTPSLAAAIARIEEMERIFDILTAADDTASHGSIYHALRRRLARYYSSAQWRADYALDEAGLLPASLKRGVLSQDGVYNFLTR